jgi:hypothetical protein
LRAQYLSEYAGESRRRLPFGGCRRQIFFREDRAHTPAIAERQKFSALLKLLRAGLT